MVEQAKEALRCRLLEEIATIEVSVAALGAPRSMEERARIARYGKLLFISQQLLKVLPRLSDTEAAKRYRRWPSVGPHGTDTMAELAHPVHRGLRRAGRI